MCGRYVAKVKSGAALPMKWRELPALLAGYTIAQRQKLVDVLTGPGKSNFLSVTQLSAQISSQGPAYEHYAHPVRDHTSARIPGAPCNFGIPVQSVLPVEIHNESPCTVTEEACRAAQGVPLTRARSPRPANTTRHYDCPRCPPQASRPPLPLPMPPLHTLAGVH